MFDAVAPAISPDTIQSLFALAVGFSIAGMCASGYRVFSASLPSFKLLEIGPMTARFAAVPLLMLTAPFIIMRNTIRGRRIEGRRMEAVMLATMIASLWSLMSGTVVVHALQVLLGVC